MTELMRQHQDLATMMRLVGENVGEHRTSGGPPTEPSAREFFDLTVRPRGQRIREHAKTLCRASLVSCRNLLHRATTGIETGGTFQMRSGVPQPREAIIVQVGEDCGNGSTGLLCPVNFGAPGSRVNM